MYFTGCCIPLCILQRNSTDETKMTLNTGTCQGREFILGVSGSPLTSKASK